MARRFEQELVKKLDETRPEKYDSPPRDDTAHETLSLSGKVS